MDKRTAVELWQLETQLCTFWCNTRADMWNNMQLYIMGVCHGVTVVEDRELVAELRFLQAIAITRDNMSLNRRGA